MKDLPLGGSTTFRRETLEPTKLFTHLYVSQSTIMSSDRSVFWIVPSYGLHLKPSATRNVIMHTTAPLVYPFFYILCIEQSLSAVLSHIHHRATFQNLQLSSPPLLPTIILDFPASTSNHLSRRIALHLATRLPSCSIVGAISTRSSAYSNSEGRPLLASLETTSMTAENKHWTQY